MRDKCKRAKKGITGSAASSSQRDELLLNVGQGRSHHLSAWVKVGCPRRFEGCGTYERSTQHELHGYLTKMGRTGTSCTTSSRPHFHTQVRGTVGSGQGRPRLFLSLRTPRRLPWFAAAAAVAAELRQSAVRLLSQFEKAVGPTVRDRRAG